MAMSPVFCACAMCDPLWVMIASTGEKGAKRGMENLENSVVFSVDSGEVSKISSTEVSHPLVYSHNLQYHGFFSLGGGTLGHTMDIVGMRAVLTTQLFQFIIVL